MCSKPRVLIWFCISVAVCGLGLSSNNRVPDLGSPGHFSQIAPFSFDRVSLYRLAMTVRTSKSPAKLIGRPRKLLGALYLHRELFRTSFGQLMMVVSTLYIRLSFRA
ncbi:hypothetical protein TNCV_1327411 [Trichonephila clavipes]|nr:hypothetical protein TNCV_1327411 [Trichonephila clavipes]